MEYFIKRVAEEQVSSGVRLLDVLTVHLYPGASNAADIVNLFRVWFDKRYTYPGAKRIDGWNETLRQEYIFQHCRDWLEQYIGPNHGIGLGVTEMGISGDDPNITAVWYASTLGVFAEKGLRCSRNEWLLRNVYLPISHIYN